jgi:glycosyltransferase involved in cell wall biosynthesis
MKRLNILYLSAKNPRDRKNYSGTPSFMIENLEKHCGNVDYFGEFNTSIHHLGKLINGLLSVFGKRIDYGHSITLSKCYMKRIQNFLRDKKYDIIFTHGITEIAFLRTKIPIVLITDATIPALSEYYPYFNYFFRFSLKVSQKLEKIALDNTSLILYPSDWVAESAKQNYGVSEQKIRIVYYGANLSYIPERSKVLSRTKNKTTCKLLFVGVDWDRKGGAIAYEAMQELNNRGIETVLTICGTIPPKKYNHRNLNIIPFLDKNNSEDQIKLSQLYLNSDFFILPTRAECAGIVFCEASSFGLPIITTKTGGVPSYVEDGLNGFSLPIEAGGKDYAKIIYDIWSDSSRYQSLSLSARNLYDEKLNWDYWGSDVRNIIFEKLSI